MICIGRTIPHGFCLRSRSLLLATPTSRHLARIETSVGHDGPFASAVNSVTNRIYVLNITSANMTVIDGSGDTVIATVPVGTNPSAVTVNSVTNRVYVDVE